MRIHVCNTVVLDLILGSGNFQFMGLQMGQAKLRGNKEERIAQSKAKSRAPEKGLYVSMKKPAGMRFVVEEVTIDDEGFFLVEMIDEPSANDMSAIGDELDPDEWFALVEQYGLIKSES
jgi:hypothetical protein